MQQVLFCVGMFLYNFNSTTSCQWEVQQANTDSRNRVQIKNDELSSLRAGVMDYPITVPTLIRTYVEIWLRKYFKITLRQKVCLIEVLKLSISVTLANCVDS